MATKGDPDRARADAAAWNNSAELPRIHRGISTSIGTAMLAYTVLRLVIIYTVSSVAEAVWAQVETRGTVLSVGLAPAHPPQGPRSTRIVDAEQGPVQTQLVPSRTA